MNFAKEVKRAHFRWKLGTVHFFRGGGGGLGAGGWWELGGSPKKTSLKGGGHLKNNSREKGGHIKYFSNALRWDMFYYS